MGSPDIQRDIKEKPFEGKRVYFSGSIKVPHPDPSLFRNLITYMKENGACILSEHVAETDPDERNSVFIKLSGIDRRMRENPAPAIREADMGWVDEATHLIAIVDTPSHGVGMELQRALDKPRMGMNLTPILCLVQEDKWEEELSNMIKGISKKDSPVAEVITYKDLEDAKRIISDFLLRY